MTKVLLAGDTHGQADWLRFLAQVADEQKCTAILQLGDFGYWEHLDDGCYYLKAASELMERYGLFLFWVDGNHENHALLRTRYDCSRAVEIRPRVTYLPRGYRWACDGVRFLALGGAYSVDKPNRVEGQSWWSEETITDDEVRKASEGGPTDVLVCHDAPDGAAGVVGPSTAGDKDRWPESLGNRRQVRRVVDAVSPKLIVHGHYHHRNSTMLNGARVEGFARDWMGADAFGVLSLPSLRLTARERSKAHG
jgi:predicted phosphodiesterase